MTQPIRVLIVDDHLVVREGLRLMLHTDPGFVVVADVADGASAIGAVARFTPDVVLMDLRLPGINGAEATRRIRAGRPSPAVVVLTTYDEDNLVLEAILAGATGYLRKDCHLRALHTTVRDAARGHNTISGALLTQALAWQQARASRTPLTERETEVLRRVAAGERNGRIAVALGITERTVRAHLSSIFTKLDADSRTAAVARGRDRGLLR